MLTALRSALIAGVFTIAGGAFAQVPGDIYLVDDLPSTEFLLFRIDPQSGDRTVVSGCIDTTFPCTMLGSGPQFGAPSGLAVANDGSIIVTDRSGAQLLYSVDPTTGNRTQISITTAGILSDVEIDSNGDLLVSDMGLDPFSLFRVLRVDKSTASTTVMTDSSSVGAGPIVRPNSLAFDPLANAVFVAGDDGATLPTSTLLDANPATGDRGLLLSSSMWNTFQGTDVQSDGQPVVSAKGAIIRVDANTGADQTLSSSGIGSGPELDIPEHLVIENDGSILVVQRAISSAMGVLRINPATGDRAALDGTGHPFVSPEGIAIVPELCGDVNADGFANDLDVAIFRDFLADPIGDPLSSTGQDRCNTVDPSGPCRLLDIAILIREANDGSALPGIVQACTAAP